MRAAPPIALMSVLMAVGACDFNVDALLFDRELLQQRMRSECSLGVPGPACSFAVDEEVADKITFDHFVERMTREQYDCLLSEPCGGDREDDDEERQQELDDYLEECIADFEEGDDDCVAECDDELFECDAGDSCEDAAVAACLREHDECKERC